MLLNHRTDHANVIVHDGFRDGEDRYMTSDTDRGVWVADQPLDEHEAAFGASVLVVDVPKNVIAPTNGSRTANPVASSWCPPRF